MSASDVRKSIGELEKTLTEEVEKRLANLEREKREAIEGTIGRRKDYLEAETTRLEAKRSALEREIALLREREGELAASVRELSVREGASLEKLERLTRIEETLSGRSAGIGAALPRSDPPFPPPGKEIGADGSSEWIAKCSLLTSRGKDSLRKLVALLIAGEVPLLGGAQAEDFLEVAQVLVAGGRAVRFEADPTVIAFEDLWTRAGTQTATALRDAATDAAIGHSRSHLCVISRADRSGARFWYPALAASARRGGLPRRLLICATLDDEKSDEAKHMLREGLSLRLDDVIAPGAGLVAPAKITGPAADVRELLVPDRAADLTPALPALARIGGFPRIAHAERMARIVIAAELLMEPLEIETFIQEIAEQIAVAGHKEGGPNLEVVATGGQHA